ncbi:RNA polymerase sigma-B factor [Lysinibacillus sp. PLM2]|nr:RNA polymerase sigma-B factor [Lysinibacillus sp. PLM2]
MSKVHHPILTNKEIQKLFSLYQETKNEEAQTTLVLHYEYLVESIARKYSQGRSNFEDLYQVGMLGLLGAIRRYDPVLGRNFEVYAIPTIVGEIKRFIRDKTWDVHVPRRIKELAPKIKTAVDQLTYELQHSPSIQEIAKFLDVQEEEVLEAMEISRSYRALSMDKSVESDFEGNSVTLFDLVGEEDIGYEIINSKMALVKMINMLSPREKEVVQLTYIHQLSQKEIGEKLEISQMHVSRILRQAIKKMQEFINTSLRV